MTYQKAKGYLAPFKAIEAFEQGLGYDIEADIEKEVGLFADCAVSDVAKNLINIFLNTRSAGRLKRIEGVEPAKIKKGGHAGGRRHGLRALSTCSSRAGFDAILWDINEQAIQKGLSAVRKTFAYAIKTKKMTEADLDAMIRERLRTTCYP